MPHPLVQWGDCLNGRVPWVDVHSLFCVGMEVQQSSYKILNEVQGLTCHVPGLELQKHTQQTGTKLSASVA